jgi:hypothetical protein
MINIYYPIPTSYTQPGPVSVSFLAQAQFGLTFFALARLVRIGKVFPIINW